MAIKNIAHIRESDDYIENISLWDDTTSEIVISGYRIIDITANPEFHIGGLLDTELNYTPPAWES